MSKLWLFNPWNDLALATGSPYYTPPNNIISLASSGETIPLWMGEPEDFVILTDKGRVFYDQISKNYVLPKPWDGEVINACSPWGWSEASRLIFRNAGIDPLLLPDDATLERFKQLSHRRLTIQLHKLLGTGMIPMEAFNREECIQALKRWRKVIGKYPWSSAGRGLFSGCLQYEDSFLRRCCGAIRHQGSVMIEPAYDVLMDFAMLFIINSEKQVEFCGMSLFNTNKRAYVSNILLPQTVIHKKIAEFIPKEKMIRTKTLIEEFLKQEVAPHYKGPVGIDMFIFLDDTCYCNYGLNPCVEINLRYTMGFVALALQRKHLSKNFQGFYKVESQSPTINPFLRLNPEGMPFSFYVSKS